MCVCACACVRVHVRACARACVCMCDWAYLRRPGSDLRRIRLVCSAVQVYLNLFSKGHLVISYFTTQLVQIQ